MPLNSLRISLADYVQLSLQAGFIQPGSDVIVCAEMDEQWGYVGAKSRQRWLFYAYDRLRKTVVVTRRSMPPCFTAPCLASWLLADIEANCGAVLVARRSGGRAAPITRLLAELVCFDFGGPGHSAVS